MRYLKAAFIGCVSALVLLTLIVLIAFYVLWVVHFAESVSHITWQTIAVLVAGILMPCGAIIGALFAFVFSDL